MARSTGRSRTAGTRTGATMAISSLLVAATNAASRVMRAPEPTGKKKLGDGEEREEDLSLTRVLAL